MDKIREWLSANLDKAAHAMACALLALIVAHVVDACSSHAIEAWPYGHTYISGAIAGVAALMAGIAKEVLDFFTTGRFSGGDLVADLAGAALGMVVFFI